MILCMLVFITLSTTLHVHVGALKRVRTSNENYADNFLKLSVRYGHCSKKGSLFVSFQEGREMSVNYLSKKL